ncbi:MAG: type II toxin-antitoxin system VapC family toxin [Deltaproteobacteria bacterium]|nr:type II toxin-antitoxin system VapC family toxin [Deltaproteobacteria bacterium]
MVIDTSALIAILCNEPERRQFNELIEAARERALSAASFVEISLVAESRWGPASLGDVDLLLARASIEIVEVDTAQAMLCRRAFTRYGKGRHPAGLNFGDCFSYALARHRDEPLLFKGKDFAQTDISSAVRALKPDT